MAKVKEDGGNGISHADAPVEIYREDSAYQTLQQRKDIIKTVVDSEGVSGTVWAPAKSFIFICPGRKARYSGCS